MPRIRQVRPGKGQRSVDLAPCKDKRPSDEKRPEGQDQPAPLTPAEEKIGEGGENLRAREKAFKRRRDTTR